VRRRLWWLPWAAFFVVMVLASKRCAEWHAAAAEVGAVDGYDPATWKPCPDRKPERWRGRRAVWYCGPDPSGQDQHDTAAEADKPDAAKRETGRVGKRSENRRKK